VTFNVNADDPALTLAGDKDVIVGVDELSPQPMSANVKRIETA
jgi:hypothetical protein